MGEYATYKGEQVKLGTCENMYYLRAEQRGLVHGGDAPSNFSAEGLAVIRFRFPFPDEDDVEPGHFEDYDRGVRIPGGYRLPETLSGSDGHGMVQFTSQVGYVLSVPCPEQFSEPGLEAWTVIDEDVRLRIGRNGFRGYPVVRQQAFRGGQLVTLVSCGACGALHRLDTLEDAEPVIEAFRAEADRQEWRRLSSDWDEDAGRWGGSCNYGWEQVHTGSAREFYLLMAARIEAGYAVRTPGEEVPA